MVGNGACANLRSVAVPLGGCRERLCEFLVGSVANGRNRDEAEIPTEKGSEVEISSGQKKRFREKSAQK